MNAATINEDSRSCDSNCQQHRPHNSNSNNDSMMLQPIMVTAMTHDGRMLCRLALMLLKPLVVKRVQRVVIANGQDDAE